MLGRKVHFHIGSCNVAVIPAHCLEKPDGLPLACRSVLDTSRNVRNGFILINAPSVISPGRNIYGHTVMGCKCPCKTEGVIFLSPIINQGLDPVCCQSDIGAVIRKMGQNHGSVHGFRVIPKYVGDIYIEIRIPGLHPLVKVGIVAVYGGMLITIVFHNINFRLSGINGFYNSLFKLRLIHFIAFHLRRNGISSVFSLGNLRILRFNNS